MAEGRDRVRLCMMVLYKYELHTLFHSLVYHWLVGIDELMICVDDRSDRHSVSDEEFETWRRLLEVVPGARVRRASEVMREELLQQEYVRACFAEALKEKSAKWVLGMDGDEYMVPEKLVREEWTSEALGAQLRGARAWAEDTNGLQQRPNVLRFDAGEYLAKYSRGVNALVVPRMNYSPMAGALGNASLVPRPPVRELGDMYFEPQLYNVSLGQYTCFPKPLTRVMEGMQPNVHDSSRLVGKKWKKQPRIILSPSKNGKTMMMCEQQKTALGTHKGLRLGNEYKGMSIFHYDSRSDEECRFKKAFSSTGKLAVNHQSGGGRRGRRGKYGCKGVSPLPTWSSDEKWEQHYLIHISPVVQFVAQTFLNHTRSNGYVTMN